MTEPPLNSDLAKSKTLILLEYFLFALCLCVIAVRVTFTEGLSAQSTNHAANIDGNLYSLLVSTVLILSFLCWLVWSFCGRKFLYRFTTIEIGLCLFVVAAVVAGFAASDKRLAITDFVMLAAPVMMAVLLVQILDSPSKVKLLLVCIAALGVVAAYECASQLLSSNEQLIEFYEQYTNTTLARQGITPNSLRHWQFEHRLYSKDIRGFFTTGNSAGSFAMLASFAAIALFLEKFKNRNSDAFGLRRLLAAAVVVAVVIFGLVVTRSKGAIIASLIAAAMLVAYLYFGSRLKAHRKTIFVVFILLIVAAGCTAVLYGLTYGRLPGGNSMLVRWQYWSASVRMYADHLFTGVGPGNFVHFYPRYKPASALETVADPHNFLLSILTQYGPLGLVGFLGLILLPLYRAVSSRPALLSPKGRDSELAFKPVAVTFLIVVSIGLLVIRPVILPISPPSLIELIFYVVYMYIMPAAAFAVGFWLLAAGEAIGKTPTTNITTAALFCAAFGFLIHNLIDFAIFEPGVFTAFCAVIACLVASDYHQRAHSSLILKPPPFAKVIVVAVVLVVVWAYFNYALIPVARSTAKIKRAYRIAVNDGFERSHELLAAAAEDDRLSPTALFLNGRLYLKEFYTYGSGQEELLASEKCLLAAIERDKAGFKNFERLVEVYILLAENSTRQAETDWLRRAFDTAYCAVERYPGCGRLRVKLAEIAEQLGEIDTALEQYEKAIDIEDSFRRQFQLMYPGREVFSRLGEQEYKDANQRIKILSESASP